LKKPAWHLTQILKTITRRYVVGTSRMATIERAQTEAIEILYRGMSKWILDEAKPELPEPLDSYIRAIPAGSPEWVNYRAIADYIAGLSDDECLARSRWIAGVEIPVMGAIH
jgi:dGTP triphosphohydrolase